MSPKGLAKWATDPTCRDTIAQADSAKIFVFSWESQLAESVSFKRLLYSLDLYNSDETVRLAANNYRDDFTDCPRGSGVSGDAAGASGPNGAGSRG